MINKSLTIGNEPPNLNGRSPSLAARASHAFALQRGNPLGVNYEWPLFQYFTRPALELTAQRRPKELILANDDDLASC
jgi:hypothetical protein